jgi:hypothetical protein
LQIDDLAPSSLQCHDSGGAPTTASTGRELDRAPIVHSAAGDRMLARLYQHLAGLVPFGRPAFGDAGVHTGNSAAELIIPRDGSSDAAIREGRDVRPFVLLPPRLSLRLDVRRDPGRYFRIGTRERYVRCPIVLRQTACRPVAAIHCDATYFRNSVLACYGLDGFPHAAIVAVLNSELMAWLHRRRHRDARQRAFPQVKIGHLAALPRPPTDGLEPSVRADLLSGLETCADAISRLSQSAGIGVKELGDLYAQCNDLVYRLYGVSREEAAAITNPGLVNSLEPEADMASASNCGWMEAYGDCGRE